LLRTTTLQNLLSSCGEDEVALLNVKMDDPYGNGRIVRRNGVVMKSIEEKDADDKEKTINEINTGVLCCSADRLKPWLENISNDNSQEEHYLTDVVGMAVADGIVVHGVTTDDQVETMGINDRRQLAEAERALQRRLVDQLMEDGVTFADPDRVDIRGKLTCGRDVFIDVNSIFEGDVHLGDNVKVESNNVIRDCRIGSGSVVHSNCHFDNAKMGSDCEIGPFARLRPGAKLADNVHIGNFVEIKKSTVADNTKINHLSYIGDSTVGTNVNIGAGTICCNYDGAHKHQTIIGDGAFVGSGVELVAPVEIGKGATIGAGSTISKPAPAGKLTLERTRQVTLASWKAPAKNK
jgi:bifunctional UDP-N-acetylglucosamine pyrophosphorylase/glucosamine-1-phosphate N-acetyltransferase